MIGHEDVFPGTLLTKPEDAKFGDRRLYLIAKRELQKRGLEDQPIQIGPWYEEQR